AKPALAAFKSFTAETTAPTARITAGPAEGSYVKDPTPTLRFASSEPGSTFQCHLDAKAFGPCSSPFTPRVALANGPHSFYFRATATDPAGNQSGCSAAVTYVEDSTP